MIPKASRLKDEKALRDVRMLPCCICGRCPVDAAHIVSRGAGGPDARWNLLPLCRIHHQEQHKIGFFRMCVKYVPLRLKLAALGWEFEGIKLRRREP